MAASRPNWQLPRGVSSGTWDYLAEPSIATEYDAFHGDHPLMRLDVTIVTEQLNALASSRGCKTSDLLIADFGCGTARVARHLQSHRARTLNVDLSQHMLATAAKALAESSQTAGLVHSNLVELNWLKDRSLDIAVCLFSSIGMIRGAKHRVAFLRHVRRALKDDGVFILHVHNRGHSWLDPQGPGWLLSTWFKSKVSTNCEYGDRVYVYRGLPKMFLHIYSRRELSAELRSAGFEQFRILPINLQGSQLLKDRTPGEYLRAGGFFALCGVK